MLNLSFCCSAVTRHVLAPALEMHICHAHSKQKCAPDNSAVFRKSLLLNARVHATIFGVLTMRIVTWATLRMVTTEKYCRHPYSAHSKLPKPPFRITGEPQAQPRGVATTGRRA